MRQLVALVKAWAFSRFASIDVRWKNSYAWTLMVIAFLQVCSPGFLSLKLILTFLSQSGVSPPILPCIHAILTPNLVAALVDNPQHDELLVTASHYPISRISSEY